MANALYETERLIVRAWAESDRPALAALNADPEVMRHFPATLSRSESDAFFDRIQERWAEAGFCFPALERKSDGAMIGFCGLARVTFEADFTPAVEIGWRLARDAWGQGYASESAKSALAYGFQTLGLPEIVSFTAVENVRSQAVMQRIGMARDAGGDFDHPLLAPGHRLRRHVLYRVRRPASAPV